MKQRGRKLQFLYSSILASLGLKTTYMMVGLISLIFFCLGYYILKKYNKKGSKLLKEIQPMQYLGIAFCVIGCLPFIEYFIIGFLMEGGEKLMDSLF